MALINCPECGKEVSETAVICPNCGFKVKKHFKRKKRKEWFYKNRIKIQIGVSTFATIVIAITLLTINQNILEQRKTFATVEEMQSYMKGTWEHRWDVLNDADTLIFSEHLLENTSKQYNHLYKVNYHPKRGYVMAGSSKYILGKDGVLQGEVLDYQKAQPMAGFTSFVDSLKFEDVKLLCNPPSNKYVTGNVKNVGNRLFDMVKVTVDFKNKDDKIIDTQTATIPYYEKINLEDDNRYKLYPNNTYTFRIETEKADATQYSLYLSDGIIEKNK